MRKLLFLVATLAYAQMPWPPAGMQCPERTLVMSEVGENAANVAAFAQEHVAYMLVLMKSGKVIHAGPIGENHGAAVLFATKDWTEVEEILKKEPFHREHVLKVTSHSVWSACEPSK